MGRFLIFIILLILLQKLFESLQKQQKQEQGESSEDEINNYFQNLGFPPPEEIKPESKPKPERPKEQISTKKGVGKTELIAPELKPIETIPLPKQTQKIEEELPIYSQDTLEEGIILSVILGPPKVYQIRRGGGIGIRAGLKNR